MRRARRTPVRVLSESACPRRTKAAVWVAVAVVVRVDMQSTIQRSLNKRIRVLTGAG